MTATDAQLPQHSLVYSLGGMLGSGPASLWLGGYNVQAELAKEYHKAAEDAARWDEETMKMEEADSVRTLKSAGYTFTQARPDEIARAVSAMKPYWDEWAKARGPEVVEALGKVRVALGR